MPPLENINTRLALPASMKFKKVFGLMVAAFMLLAFMQFLMPAFASSPAPASGGTFVVGTIEDEIISDQNPLTASGLSGDVLGLTYADSLAYVYESNATAIPWLASSWAFTNNDLTLTFNLVHNAYWMNGTNKAGLLTAQDVLFTFNVLKANATLDVNSVFPTITNISAPNNYTVVFTLSSYNPVIFDYIAMQTIIPHTWSNYVKNLSDIGSFENMAIGDQCSLGPMILKNVTSTSVNMVANPYFFKGKPNFAAETWDLFSSSSSMVESLEAGTIDAAYDPPATAYPQLVNFTGVKAVAFDEPYNNVLWFNDKVAPYNNTDFRVGLAYALNKTQILYKAEYGLGGKVSFGGLPWTLSQYYNTSVAYPSFNYTKANQYFTDAGLHIGSSGYWEYANGTIVSLSMIDLSASDWDTSMTLMQTDLQHDHFKVSFDVVATQVWVTDIFSTPNFTQASFFNFGPLLGNPWFDLWAEYSYNGYWNFEGYNNATMNHLLNVSEAETFNSPAFNATLDEIQGFAASQMPTVPIMGSQTLFAYEVNKIGGMNLNQQPDSPLDSEYAYMLSQPTTSSGFTTLDYAIIGIIVVIAVVAIAAGVVISGKNKKKE